MVDAIVDHLRQTIGLDSASIGLGTIARAIQQRIAAANAATPEDYHRILEESPGEMRDLIDLLVVPETWFFRDRGAFAAVAAAATAPGRTTPLRYLCVPCATGEEPLSLAMTLLDAGVPAERFHIDAFDISERFVAHAERGLYGRNSFRGTDVEYRARYFEETRDGCAIDCAVRHQITFRCANLLNDSAFHGAQIYDAIFCRNLLIYFDLEARGKAVKKFSRLLRDNGLLCVAPAETGLLLRQGYAPIEAPQAFAFRKEKPRPVTCVSVSVKTRHPNPSPAPLPLRCVDKPLQARLAAVPSPAPPGIQEAPPPEFAEAIRLADEGRFEDVLRICRAHIDAHGASAEAYYLLALVSDASAHYEEAATLYRKALYLDPQHRDALAHFSLLADKLGETAAAGALRRRAMRVEPNVA